MSKLLVNENTISAVKKYPSQENHRRFGEILLSSLRTPFSKLYQMSALRCQSSQLPSDLSYGAKTNASNAIRQ